MAAHWSTWPEPWTSEPVRAPHALARPAFEVPDGACDAHMHVFGPVDRYPGVPNARYSAPKSEIDDYLAMADALHLRRMVFTQASFYGTDNSYLLHALERVGKRGRAVVMLLDQLLVLRHHQRQVGHRGGARNADFGLLGSGGDRHCGESRECEIPGVAPS